MALLAAAAGAASAQQALEAPPARAPVPTGVVAGRVLGPNGEPVVGAVVRTLPARGAGAPNASPTTPSAVTAADGRFALRGVPAGVVRLEVHRLGYAPRAVADVAVRPGKPAEVRVVLEPAAATLTGVTARPSYFPALPTPAAPVSAASFTTEEMRRAPGVEEDPVRAVSALPGVSPTTESRNDLVVRGGAPSENLFVVDGVEVPNVNHFGAQGSTGGAVSMLPVDFVREATLSTGGFGARWGDRASGVVDLALREGTRERVAGQLNVAATGAGAFAEGPLGRRGSFLAGARRSYLDFIFRALRFTDFLPAYHDATLKAVLRPSARDELSWFAVGGRGSVTFDTASADARYRNRDVVAPNQTQLFTGLTWRRRVARGVATATLGRTDTRFATAQRGPGAPGVPGVLLLRANTREAETQLRTEAAWTLPGGLVVEAGNLAKYADRLRYDVLLPAALRRDAAGRAHPLAVDTAFAAFRDAAYAQLTRPLAPRLRATFGARADYYAFLNHAVRVAPRASLAWAPDDRSAVTLAAGRYWQAPQPIWLAGDALNRPSAGGGGVRPFRADHLVAGYQRTPRPDLQVRVEAYAKRYGLYPARVFRPRAVLQPVAFDNALTDIPFGLEPLASAGTGRVVGAELLVQKKLSEVPVYGLAAVAVSRARFRALEGRPAPGAFDMPVIATVLGGWRPGAGWELSSRARLASGAPTTPFRYDALLGGAPDFARYGEGPRRPHFFQLDARVDRRFAAGRGGRQLVAYVDVLGVTGRRNAYAEEWSLGRGAPVSLVTLGRLPTAGLNWAF